MDDPSWTWPAWKFDMNREDLFTKLHDQYNTYPSTIQEPVAFHHDIFEISYKANSVAEFHRLADVRKHQRLNELNKALESASFEIIANPSLISTAQWQHAVQLFRTHSFDSIVRYFGSYLPSDPNRHWVPHTAVPVTNNVEFFTGLYDGDNEWTRRCVPINSNYKLLPSFAPDPADLSDKLVTDQCVGLDERTDAITSAEILISTEAEHQRFPPLVSGRPIISDKGILSHESELSITPGAEGMERSHKNRRACYQQGRQEEDFSTMKLPETFSVSEGMLKSQDTGDLYGEGLAQYPVVISLATAIASKLPQTSFDSNDAIHLTNRVMTGNKRKRL